MRDLGLFRAVVLVVYVPERCRIQGFRLGLWGWFVLGLPDWLSESRRTNPKTQV